MLVKMPLGIIWNEMYTYTGNKKMKWYEFMKSNLIGFTNVSCVNVNKTDFYYNEIEMPSSFGNRFLFKMPSFALGAHPKNVCIVFTKRHLQRS